MSEICAADMRQVEYFNAVSFQVRTIVNCDVLAEVLLHFFTQHVSGEVALRDTTKTHGWLGTLHYLPPRVCVYIVQPYPQFTSTAYYLCNIFLRLTPIWMNTFSCRNQTSKNAKFVNDLPMFRTQFHAFQ